VRFIGSVDEREDSLVRWLSKELKMAPNMVSLSMLVSGPLIATLILQESWPLATIGLVVSGVLGYTFRQCWLSEIRLGV